MRQQVNWILLLCGSVLLAISGNAQTPTPTNLLPLPPELQQHLSAVAVLYSVSHDGKAKPFGYGFFVNPWTIVTSNRLLQDANRDGALRLTIYSADGKQNYNQLYVDIADKDRDLLTLETHERGPRGLPQANVDKLKPGDKVYVLRAKPGNTPTYVLAEVKTPLGKEHCGEPLFNEAGQLLGMGIDPALKSFAENGLLPAKALSKFSMLYASAYKNGKLTCPENFPCQHQEQPGENKKEIKPLLSSRPFVGNFDDESFMPPPKTDPKALPKDSGVQGKSIRRVQPPYPDAAKRGNIAGSVQVRLVYDEQGEVIMVRPINGPPMLQRVCVEAARQWLFEPTLLQSKKIQVEGFLTFNFTLSGTFLITR
jgi:Gram-negative bacterial TonB protein C-terminal